MCSKRAAVVFILVLAASPNLISGNVPKLEPALLESLYSGNLTVAVRNDSSTIRGRLSGKLVLETGDAPHPYLLKREDPNLPSSAAGLAWLAVDSECHVQYDITLNGMGNQNKQYELELELYPMMAPNSQEQDRLGHDLQSNIIDRLQKKELLKLDSGVAFIKVKDRETKNTLLSANLKDLRVPKDCFPNLNDNDVPTITILQDVLTETVPNSGTCLHEGRLYQDEAQWTSFSNPCKMCFCQNGNTKCDTTTCPHLDCPNYAPIQRKLQTECCPVCTNDTSIQRDNAAQGSSQKGCTFGGNFHSAGANFHPFLIPSGFDRCTECFCDPLSLEVKCTRKPNEKICLSKVMRDTENGTLVADDNPNMVEMYRRRKPARSPMQVLSEGGCRNPINPSKPYENGAKFHPFIDSLGEYKCVTCHCKNGLQNCERQKCTKAACQKMLRRHKADNHNTNEFCCSMQQCRRFRRHRRGGHANRNS